jgi:hypothetical protein
MTRNDLIAHLARIGVPPEGIDYVVRSAEAPPSRKVGGGQGTNLVGERATSLRTALEPNNGGRGRLQFESLSAEFAFLANLEYERRALLVLDQPEPIPLVITTRANRPMRVSYTVDFLVVDETAVKVFQLKTDSDAHGLVETKPNDWVLEDGRVAFRTADAYFAHLGIAHTVVCSSDLPWIRIQNLQMLMSWQGRTPAIDAAAIGEVARYVTTHSPASVHDLINALQLPGADVVLASIMHGAVHVPIDHANLCDPHSRVICTSKDDAENIGRTLSTVQAITASSAGADDVIQLSPKHMAYFGYRLALVRGGGCTATAW